MVFLYSLNPLFRLVHYVYHRGGRGFLGGSQFFWKGTKGGYQNFWQKKGGLLICFSPFIKIRKHCFVDFFIREDYLNYSMLKESLLAYLLDKYTLYRTLTINITVKCFYCKAIIAFESTTTTKFQWKVPSFFNWKIVVISVFSSRHWNQD